MAVAVAGSVRSGTGKLATLLLMGILCWVFSAGLARDLKIGLVDLDQSLLSRELAFSLDASAGLKVAQQFDSIEAGARALRGVTSTPWSCCRATWSGMPGKAPSRRSPCSTTASSS